MAGPAELRSTPRIRDTFKFSAITGALPLIEKYPLEKAADAYLRMMSGKAEFRVVLTM